MRIKTPTDLIAGLFFASVGILFVVAARNYKMGTAGDMGPAYFPSLLGWLLVVLGAAVCALGFRARKVADTPHSTRGLLIIIGSVVLFGVMLTHAGLIATVFVVTIVSSLASPTFSVSRALKAAVSLAVLCYLIFVVAIDLQVQVWPQVPSWI